MPVNTPRPTSESIADLYNHLYVAWGPKLGEDEHYRSMLLQTNEIELMDVTEDRNIKPIAMHSGRAGGVIGHARGLIMAPPVFEVRPVDIDNTSRMEAEQTEKVLAALFETQVLANDFWADVAKDVLTYGRGFAKAVPLPHVWTLQSGYPVRKKNERPKTYLKRVAKWKEEDAKFPFVLQRIPTLNILPLLDENDNVVASIEIKAVMAGVLAELGSNTAQEKINNGIVNWWDEMSVIEYMDTNYIGYFVAGSQIHLTGREDISVDKILGSTMEEFKVVEHGLGKCPVVMFAGIKTGEDEYLHRYKSFLFDASESLQVYDMLLSRLTTMIGAYYLPSYLWKYADVAASWENQERPEVPVNLGGTTVVFSDEELIPLPYPTDLPDASMLIREVDDIIQRHTIEDVLFGRAEGSAPAFQVNLRINVAKSKLTPIANEMARGVVRMMDLFVRGVEWLGESVPIGGEKMTVKAAKKARGRIGASIIPKSPVDRNADIGSMQQALEAGLPWEWAVENILDEQNPAHLKILKLVEEFEDMPEIKSAILQDIVKDFFSAIEEEEMEEVDPNDPTLPGALSQAAEQEAALLQEQQAAGLGRGPFPDGGSPQATGGGRGLLTPNEQPQPGTPQVGDEPPIT
jgi:hypothetical protein